MITDTELIHIREQWRGIYTPGWGLQPDIKSPEMILGEYRGLKFHLHPIFGYMNIDRNVDGTEGNLPAPWADIEVEDITLLIVDFSILLKLPRIGKDHEILEGYVDFKNNKEHLYMQKMRDALKYDRLYNLED